MGDLTPVFRHCIHIGSHERDANCWERKDNINMYIHLAATQQRSFPLAMSETGRSCSTVQHYESHQCCSGVGEMESKPGAKVFPASPWKSVLAFHSSENVQ